MLFTIPIKPKMKTRNWPLIEELLNGTLRSLAGQTDRNLEVIIACHEQPAVDASLGLKVRFVEATWRPRDANKDVHQDKWRKKRMLGAAAREHGGGYVMLLDADDRLSNRLVEHVYRQASPHGYLIQAGYALDYRSATIGPMPGVWPKTFDIACGSCAIWKLAPDDLPADYADKGANYWNEIKSHRAIEGLAKLHGRPLDVVPFPAGVYVQNTGENSHDKVLRDRAAAVAGEIAAHRVPLTDALVKEFALGDVVDFAAGRATSALHRPSGLLDRIKDRFFAAKNPVGANAA